MPALTARQIALVCKKTSGFQGLTESLPKSKRPTKFQNLFKSSTWSDDHFMVSLSQTTMVKGQPIQANPLLPEIPAPSVWWHK